MRKYTNYKSSTPVVSEADKFKKTVEESYIKFEEKGVTFPIVTSLYRDEMIRAMDLKFKDLYIFEEMYDWKLGKYWMTFTKK
jgi:hypothetical protein